MKNLFLNSNAIKPRNSETRMKIDLKIIQEKIQNPLEINQN